MPEFRVVGERVVFGTEPGETFSADLSDFDEQRLIEGGHIARVDKPSKGLEKKESQ